MSLPDPIGRALPHESARAHVQGSARYTADLPDLAGTLHAAPVCAPHARARLVALDVSAALAHPGVATVLTAADVPGVNDSSAHGGDEPLFADPEVLYWGHAVAWVLAESEAAARAGAALVRATCEPLPALLSIEAAIAAGSFHGPEQRLRWGDPEAALARAPHRLEGELFVGAQDHFYLETHTAYALLEPDHTLHVYSSTQHPSETQGVVAQVLGVPANRVTVTCLRMGGGFGGKESQGAPYAAVAALGALKTGRPVRVRLRRSDDMVMTGKRHPFWGRYEVGFHPDGTLGAVVLELFSDGGFSSDLSLPVMGRALFHADNAYYAPHRLVRGRVCKTHKTSQTAFRGFGGPQGMLFAEEIIDRVARSLGLPPDAVRARNLYCAAGARATTHYGQLILDSHLERVWHEVLSRADVARRRAELAAFNAAHPHCKRALAVTPVKFGISFTKTPMNQAGALVLIYLDGSVQLNHGGTEMGQGLLTKTLQVAAATLGVPLERLRVMPTATDKVPNTSPTAASSGSDLNGQAVKAACETLKGRLAGVAAKLLGLSAPEVLRFEGGEIFCPYQPQRRLLFTDVVRQAYLEQVPLFATGYYRTPNLHFDPATGRGRPFHYFACGAAASEVEVDGFTGAFKLRRVDIVQDVGAPLNPLIDRGQIEGGFVQGLGWLTMEEALWDAAGRFVTNAPSTYKIPTIADVPEAFHVAFLPDAATPGVIGGSKAVGEPPLMLALSVREALREAVAAFTEAPPRRVELAAPATPEAILWAIERVRAEPVRDLVSGD
ncbi:xanthine dehydrogenase molybdopterin binding subunit [Truepera radiovictrix]|uniref:Xanthine dehydrogenase, molybdopterin binding subunit n=1 Tax=Truepera radiovictrix (strain DSM 17093 / CIP 108686 / LMG 22925 / RQ-24) TaxID=649638 RepID=D7CXN0_TRURR|nr:xanthine dehydrogenase molybdopterin binding subunit [Truepera radiovictrix]ADI14632.1 xanthine dehydrogenase, molybdopterin binding subunit [Truepera radiovictrix DSM 17093]WMT56818.1 xanthine dehydrogenase molybdopterin binding subunit [Truepera radiovictrix]